MLNLRNCIIDVSGVCNFLDSVLSQQKFEVTDGPVLQPHVICSDGPVLLFHVTAVLFRKQRKIHPQGVRGADTKDVRRRDSLQPNFGSSFYVFPPPPEPALYKLG